MRQDPDQQTYGNSLYESYNQLNYEKGLAAWFMRKIINGQRKKYSQDNHFSKVSEVGTGTGSHFQEVRHTFDQYIILDVDDQYLKRL